MRRAAAVFTFLALVATAAAAASWAVAASEDTPAVAADPVTPLATPILSARRLPATLAAPVADRRLEAALRPFLDATPGEDCLVVSSGGRRLVEVDPTRPLIPASNQKLLVAHAALAELGADTRLRTTAVVGASPGDGVIDGDLWLVGGGDPLLTTADYRASEDPPRPHSALEDLADQLAALGIREIRGDVVGDDSRYDDRLTVPAWPDRSLNRSQPGALSALAVNKGYAAYPTSPEDRSGPTPSNDPARDAAAHLIRLLDERGVTVTGRESAGEAPGAAIELAAVESLTVAELVDEMNRYSDNTTAEMLVKAIGHHRSGTGSTEAGTVAMAEVLAADGFSVEGAELLDGSGLARDRVTCDLLADVLEAAGRDSPLAASLPVAAESGTLRVRFRGTEAAGRLRAKTGFLNEATALSGYVDTIPGEVLVFSYIGNDASVSQAEVDLQEQLGEALVRYPEGVDLDLLEPRQG